MKPYQLLPLLFFTTLLPCGCDGDLSATYIPTITVEGWIEQGESPVVIVTSSTPAAQVKDDYAQTMSADDFTIKGADVWISTDGKDYQLTGRDDDAYLQSYVYTTEELVGEVGKTYRLTVNYKEHHVSGTTHILPVVVIGATEIVNQSPNRYSIDVCFNDDATTKDYYQLFAQTDQSHFGHYPAAFLGSLDDAVFTGNEVRTTVFKGKQNEEKHLDPYFRPGDVIDIKLCHVDVEAYRFWVQLEKTILLSRNQFLTVKTNLQGNLKGANGYWFGYGTSHAHIVIP